jgi:hypothetical protein
MNMKKIVVGCVFVFVACEVVWVMVYFSGYYHTPWIIVGVPLLLVGVPSIYWGIKEIRRKRRLKAEDDNYEKDVEAGTGKNSSWWDSL